MIGPVFRPTGRIARHASSYLSLKGCFSLCASAASLFLLSSCEFWEDWCDGDKPPPPDPITAPCETRTSYTREEAMSLVCNKLIMKFSMMPEKPCLVCPSPDDDMALGVYALLLKANAVDVHSPSAPGRLCYSLGSAQAEPGFWHPMAAQVPSGKILLDETIPLASGADGGR